MTGEKTDRRYLTGLVVGALGVVYGDIGTSPLYSLRECFNGPHAIRATHDNVLGVLSLIFWSLILIVSVKYLTFVLRADNKGEGGILALMALAFPEAKRRACTGKKGWMIALGVFGAALLYGDGMITPSITVLSAVEGLEVATDQLQPYIVPITIVILILLFAFQKHGTGKVGGIFGPITFIWFIAIGLIGLPPIIRTPSVLLAFNPYHALLFFQENGMHGFVVLGSVFLCVTGAEALYADMGHFGRRPIQLAWFFVVLPALIANYLGQGALLLERPQAAVNPFFRLCPPYLLIPMVILATAASVIASQALITGAFSLTMQAIQLGYSPRMQIDHTSASERGQIYMPKVNWILLLACIGLVIGFESSSNLAAAYGIAVTLTMGITTILFYFAARNLWNWSRLKAGSLCGLFLLIELAFFGANVLKIAHGGWFPLLIGAGIFTLMSTWKKGRAILGSRLRAGTLPITMFLDEIKHSPPQRVKGTAIFLSGNPDGTPLALMHNLKHNKVLHEQVIIMTLQTVEVPHVDARDRLKIEKLDANFYKVIGKFGFMEDPDVMWIVSLCKKEGLELREETSTFFLSRETIIATKRPGMFIWRERLFSFMSRNAQSATVFFRLPPNRVVELGMQVEI
jgi:KUP system potassium uptake protein